MTDIKDLGFSTADFAVFVTMLVVSFGIGIYHAVVSPNSKEGKICSGLEKSPFGAKSDFEIWAFKVFLFFGPEKSSKEGLEVATPENLKWKKYIRQSENANGSPLEPLWGSKKLKVSTKRTLRPTNLPFWFGEKSSWCRFEKKRNVQKVLNFWSGEKS